MQVTMNKWFNTSVDIPVSKTEHVRATIEGNARLMDESNKSYHAGILVRVNPKTLSKQGRIYFKQFKCLNPSGINSCLYILPEKIVRQNVEGKVTQKAPKGIKSKR